MKENELNIDETTLSIDLSDATEAVKESRFKHALNLLENILKDHPAPVSYTHLTLPTKA